MPGAALATALYVALNGSDSNTGTSRAAAFATLRKCVAAAPAGGTCVLGGGRYDRAKDWPSGAIEITRDITIVGDPQSAKRAVLDGSVAIETQWTAGTGDEKCVYTSSPMDVVPWQLWATGSAPSGIASPAWALDGFAPLTPARFPNARLSDDSVFDSAPLSHTGRTNSSFLYSSKISTPGHLTEDGAHAPSLASSGLDLTGAIAVLPLGTMGKLTQGVVVLKHGAGAAGFTYKSPVGTAGKGHTNIPFYFEGACSLLDAEGEWCIGTATSGERKVLKVWLDGCAAPSSVALRGKRMDYLLNVTARKVALSLADVTLWGATLAAPQATLSLDGVELLHPQAMRNTLGVVGAAGLAAETTLKFNSAAGSLRMVNSTVEWSQSVTPLDLLGRNAFVSDCRFLRSGYNGGLSASLGDGGMGTGLVFQHNAVQLFNSFTGLTPGLKSTVAYNIFAHGSTLADGAGVHVHIKAQDGVVIYRNWAHDLVIKAFRFDRVNSPTATWGTNGTVLENVAWRCGSACFKGDKHLISSNTVFDSSDENDGTAALFVMMYDPTKPWAIPNENAHTRLEHNAADSIFNVSGVLPGRHVGNVANVAIRSMLTSPATGDFRPKAGSALEAAAAGAFATADAARWVPGPRGGGAAAVAGEAGHSDVACGAAECAYWNGLRRHIATVRAAAAVHGHAR
jgi:hypothetical protein